MTNHSMPYIYDECVENNYAQDIIPDELNPYLDKEWMPQMPNFSSGDAVAVKISPRARNNRSITNFRKHKVSLKILISEIEMKE